MQFSNLIKADAINANFRGAVLHCAFLTDADLKGASFDSAELNQADMRYVTAQRADFFRSSLQSVDFGNAELQGARIFGVHLDRHTSLTHANLRGAALRYIDIRDMRLSPSIVRSFFGDATVKFPEGVHKPKHFYKNFQGIEDYEAAWRAWQAEIGFDPDDPSTW